HALAREHGQPHEPPRPPGDLLRPPVRPRRDHGRDREGAEGGRAAHRVGALRGQPLGQRAGESEGISAQGGAAPPLAGHAALLSPSRARPLIARPPTRALVPPRRWAILAPVGLRFRVLGSGSTGNATLVETSATRILLDAGLGPRILAERLESVGVDPASVDAVVVSHEHGDHAGGAAAFVSKWGMKLCGSRGTYAAAGFGAEDIPGYEVMQAGAAVTVGDVTVTAVAAPHDAAEPLAFVISAGSLRLGHVTDVGHLSRGL